MAAALSRKAIRRGASISAGAAPRGSWLAGGGPRSDPPLGALARGVDRTRPGSLPCSRNRGAVEVETLLERQPSPPASGLPLW